MYEERSRVTTPREAGIIALDLPGYGLSDKPLDATYDFEFYGAVLDGFLDFERKPLPHFAAA